MVTENQFSSGAFSFPCTFFLRVGRVPPDGCGLLGWPFLAAFSRPPSFASLFFWLPAPSSVAVRFLPSSLASSPLRGSVQWWLPWIWLQKVRFAAPVRSSLSLLFSRCEVGSLVLLIPSFRGRAGTFLFVSLQRLPHLVGLIFFRTGVSAFGASAVFLLPPSLASGPGPSTAPLRIWPKERPCSFGLRPSS
jgi:hypothetical protein